MDKIIIRLICKKDHLICKLRTDYLSGSIVRLCLEYRRFSD